MATSIQRVEYFQTTVRDQPGEAYELLSNLASQGINMLAFSAVPMGPMQIQLMLFPEAPARLVDHTENSSVVLEGPYSAILVQGDDELGALADIHASLYKAKVNVAASSGVTDGRGAFGYILYIHPEDCDRAATALGV